MTLGTACSAAVAYRTYGTVEPAIGNISQRNAGQVESPVALITEYHLPVGSGRRGSRRRRRCSSASHGWTVHRCSTGTTTSSSSSNGDILSAVALLAGFTLETLPRVFRGAFEHFRRHVDAGRMSSSPADRTANETFRFVLLVSVLRSLADRT